MGGVHNLKEESITPDTVISSVCMEKLSPHHALSISTDRNKELATSALFCQYN